MYHLPHLKSLQKTCLYFLIILHFRPLKYKYGFQTYQGNKLTRKNGRTFQGCTCHEIAPSLHFPRVSGVSLEQIDRPPLPATPPLEGYCMEINGRPETFLLQLQ